MFASEALLFRPWDSARNGVSPWAFHEGVQLLLACGAIDTSTRDNVPGKQLFLYDAIIHSNCSLETVRLLLPAGAHETFSTGTSPFFAAIRRERWDLLPALERHRPKKEDGDALCWAAWKGKSKLLQYLIDMGGIARRQTLFTRVLQMAVRAGQPQCMKPLIQAGADIQADYTKTWPYTTRRYRVLQCSTAFAVAVTEFVHSLRGKRAYYMDDFEIDFKMEADRLERISKNCCDVLFELLRNGIDPRQSLIFPSDFKTCKDKWWSSTTGSLRPEDLLRDWPSIAEKYFEIIHNFYPQTLFHDGDIYWDAAEYAEGLP